MAPHLHRKTVLTAVAETTIGTAVAYAATDAVLAEEVTADVEQEINERSGQRNTLSWINSVPGARYQTISFTTEYKTSGDATTPTLSALDPLFLAAGLKRTSVTGGVEYQPASIEHTGAPGVAVTTGWKSATIRVHRDGEDKVLNILNGCLGTGVITLEAGGIPKIAWTFSGQYTAITDGAETMPVEVEWESSLPKPLVSIAATIDSYVGVVKNLSVDFGTEIVMRKDCNSANGVKSFWIVGRKPRFSITLETVKIATQPHWTKLIAGTEVAMSYDIDTGGGDNNLQGAFTGNMESLKISNDGGIYCATIEGGLHGFDDEIVLQEGTPV